MADDLVNGGVPARGGAAGSTRFPRDILILAGVAAHLWAITAVWLALDIPGRLDGVKVTETGVWLLALSGLMFLVLAILQIVLTWGKLLAGVTGLLVLNLLLLRFPMLLRWAISLVGASVLVLATGLGTIDRGGRPDPAAVPLLEEGMPTAADIAARERALAARCVAPRDPNVVAYCRARDDALRILNDPG